MNFTCELVGLANLGNSMFPGDIRIIRSFFVSFSLYTHPFLNNGCYPSRKLPDRYKILRDRNKIYINITDVQLSDAGWWGCTADISRKVSGTDQGNGLFMDVIRK